MWDTSGDAWNDSHDVGNLRVVGLSLDENCLIYMRCSRRG